jgi:hypothetical protein
MNLDLILSKCEVVHPGESVELVDVTLEIVKLLDPSERILKIVEQQKRHEPFPREVLRTMNAVDGGRFVAFSQRSADAG